MKVLRGFDSLDPARFTQPVATIGVFDGMHLGHRAVIDSTRDLARGFEGESVAVTFEIHPRLILTGKTPAPITSVSHRLVLMERYGLDHTVLLPFNDQVRNMSAEEFADRVFLRGLAVKGIVLGFDSRFGKDRQGDLGFVTEWAEEKGIVVRSAPPVLKDGRPISSSVIRDAIARGKHELAQAMLGRPVAVYGRVVPGSGRGRDIGFGTANLDLEGELSPPEGVYAAWARRGGRWMPALVNIGRRPTFDANGGTVTVEVHIPGLSEDLYGEEIEVQFIRRIRGERRFKGAEELVAQIGRDRDELFRLVEEVRRPPAPPAG
jgi:riboflavin kinase/FMN adenylyltransferase